MKIITVTANDGKTFTGEDYYKLEKEVMAYEEGLKTKEEEKRAKEKEEIKAFEEIKKGIKNLNTMIKEFNLATGKSVSVYNLNGELFATRDFWNPSNFRSIFSFLED